MCRAGVLRCVRDVRCKFTVSPNRYELYCTHRPSHTSIELKVSIIAMLCHNVPCCRCQRFPLVDDMFPIFGANGINPSNLHRKKFVFCRYSWTRGSKRLVLSSSSTQLTGLRSRTEQSNNLLLFFMPLHTLHTASVVQT